MNKKIALTIATVFSLPLVAGAENVRVQDDSMRARMGEVREIERFNKLVDDSTAAYQAIAKGSHGEVPSNVLKNARCIAVLPNVVTGALVVGGTHGEGLASCKDGNNNWSQPAPISFNQGSIGLQAGAKSADLVLFFQNANAVQALKRGNFTMGADVSAVAGSYDKNLDTSRAGVVAYSRAEGVFAGASITGGKIGKDQDRIGSYYGTQADYTSILEGRTSPDSTNYAKKLTSLFPA